MPNGITFDGKHSYDDFGLWLSERPNLASPVAKTNTVEVPGMDGVLDLTEANAGEVKFRNRNLVFTFAAMVKVADQEEFKAVIRNALHGKKIQKIVLDEDPDWYYTGRASVEFEDILPWKLRCIVTVDANPYAMKNVETVVDLNDTTKPQTQNWVTLAENNSQSSWNSNFALGTIEFPSGVEFYSSSSRLRISWPEAGDVHYAVPSIYINSVGATLSYDVTQAEIAQKYVEFSESDLTNAGLDLSKIFRVTVSGISNCALELSQYSTKYVVVNSRKSVIPTFILTATGPALVTVNGVTYSIPLRSYTTPEIVLKHGENEIYVQERQSISMTAFTMKFREGKL